LLVTRRIPSLHADSAITTERVGDLVLAALETTMIGLPSDQPV